MRNTQSFTPPSVSLDVRLFGPFDARRNGAPVPPFRTRKEQWLLALLILRQGRTLERIWLAGQLWPDSEESLALYNLRRSLSNLRATLGEEAFVITSPTRNTLRFEPLHLTVDVTEFDREVGRQEASSLERAVDLYRGPLLEGCLEEWLLPERDRREQEVLRALERLAAHRMPDDPAAAARYLRQTLALDPLRESALRNLMSALAAFGDYAAALTTYQEARRKLMDEFHEEISLETTAVFQSVREEARRRATRREPTPSPPMPEKAIAEKPVEEPTPPPGFLPLPLTQLVGREEECSKIREKLDEVRMVTLTGMGGVGKTRLSLAVGAALRDAYKDGVWFVDLTQVGDPAYISQEIAFLLGCPQEPRSPLETLGEQLQNKQILLILDNCEHVIEECGKISVTLLRSCPQLRLLATSRQRLNVPGETTWSVSPLETPSPALVRQHRAAADGGEELISLVSHYPATQLFLERTKQVLSTFQLNQTTAEAVATLCRRLDGIPLAIELAAARVKVLTVEQITARLNDRFRLLTGGSRLLLPRQQTLRALIDWSHDLLTEPEAILFRRLAVFSGGWTLEAVEAVGADQADDVLDLLMSLVDKSLVMHEACEGQLRFRFLETVRQYSLERLRASGEEGGLRRRHRDHYLAWVEEVQSKLSGPEQFYWLDVMEADHENLRQALTYSIEEAGEVEPALRIARGLRGIWLVRNHLNEAHEFLTRLLALGEDQEPTLLYAAVLGTAGRVALRRDDYLKARACYSRSLAIYRQFNNLSGIAAMLHNLGQIARYLGEFDAAMALYEDSLRIERERNDPEGIGVSLGEVGRLAYDQRDLATARSLLTEAIELLRPLGNQRAVAFFLNCLGNAVQEQGDFTQAHSYYMDSLTVLEEVKDESLLNFTRLNLSRLACDMGDDRQTYRALTDCSLRYRDMEDKGGQIEVLKIWASLLLRHGRPHQAARLSTVVSNAKRKIGTPSIPIDREREERFLTDLQDALGDAFDRAAQEGGALSTEQAIQLAITELSQLDAPGEDR